MDENEPQNIETPEVEVESSIKKHFFTVTPFSKYLAMVLFVTLPLVGIWLGFTFSKATQEQQIFSDHSNISDQSTETEAYVAVETDRSTTAIFKPFFKEGEDVILYPQHDFDLKVYWVGEYSASGLVKLEEKKKRIGDRKLRITGEVSFIDSNETVIATGSAFITGGGCGECQFEELNGEVFEASISKALETVPSGEYTAVIIIDSEDILLRKILIERFVVQKNGEPQITITSFESDGLYIGGPTITIRWNSENLPERETLALYLMSEYCEDIDCQQFIQRYGTISAAGIESGVKWNDFINIDYFKNTGTAEFRYDEIRYFLNPFGNEKFRQSEMGELPLPLPPVKYKYVLSYNNVHYNREKYETPLDPEFFIHFDSEYFEVK